MPVARRLQVPRSILPIPKPWKRLSIGPSNPITSTECWPAAILVLTISWTSVCRGYARIRSTGKQWTASGRSHPGLATPNPPFLQRMARHTNRPKFCQTIVSTCFHISDFF
ncbi:hypothetical protein B0H12DRAFT_1111589 [Mycena haematopus]|nr:hypothetical protein B0H12DRAFT_1111589 [Mycena haematopus]